MKRIPLDLNNYEQQYLHQPGHYNIVVDEGGYWMVAAVVASKITAYQASSLYNQKLQ